MNALTAPRKRRPNFPYPPGLTLPELLAEWEARLSLQLVEHEGGCIEWTRMIDHPGACHAPTDLRALLFPKRSSLTFTIIQALWVCRHGSLPKGTLCRTCRHSWCVAPEHRELRTEDRRRRQRLRSREQERLKRLARVPKAQLLGDWEVSISKNLVEHDSGCIEWTGHIDANGVGVVRVPADVQRRFGFSDHLTVAQALWVCRMNYHSAYNLSRWCSSPWCVAPEHRFAATPQHIRGRERAQREARKRGKAFDLEKWGAARTRERLRMRQHNQRIGRLKSKPGTHPTGAKATPKQAENRRRANLVAQRRRRALNPETVRAQERARYHADPERARERQRRYRLAHRDEVNARRRADWAARRAQAQQVQP